MNKYIFNEPDVFNKIQSDWTEFMKNLNSKICIIGISGGIDSTCVAALACRIFGQDNVYGLSMPCNGQKDIDDVNLVFNTLKIKRLNFDIGDSFDSIINGIENNAIDVSPQTKTNLPARLRMSVLYAFSQSIPNSIVINTCNLSEDILGWNTFGGDNIGSYAPIRWLTKTEVRKLALWLGVNANLVTKIPIDGLQPLSDEDNFGFSYCDLDDFIRTGNEEFKFSNKVLELFKRNKFKLDIINLPGPKFDFPNFIEKLEKGSQNV